MKILNKWLLFFSILSISGLANAADVVSIIQDSMAPAIDILATQAIKWLAIFALLQMFITNFGLLKSGADIEAVIGKFIGSIAWFSFCIYIMTAGPGFISDVGQQFFNLLGETLPRPTTIIGWVTPPGIGLITGGIFVGGIGAVGSVVGGQILVNLGYLVILIGIYFAIKIYMIQLELALIVMLSPLSFTFLSLNSLKDQGIAPFKSLISLAYRIILMTLIIAAFSEVSSVMLANLKDGLVKLGSASNMVAAATPGIDAYGVDDLISDIMSGLISYIMLAFLLYKSDSIAASLSSGSTNMGAGDVAAAAAAGAALGAASNSAASSTSDLGVKGGQSMSDFMKSLNSSASVSNASSSGAGGAESKPVGTAPPPPAKKPEMSLADNNAARVANNPVKSSSSSSGGPSTFAERPSLASRQEARGGTSGSSSNSESAATEAANTIDNLASSGQLKDAGSAKHVSDHLKSMESSPGDSKAVGETPNKASPSDSGSGSSAGIGGASSATDQKLDQLIETMGQPKKPGLKDRLANANDHMAKEQATTHVSINTNVE
ncbi:MAG: hypothetical protein WC009_07865 [Methylotenera sp.]